MSAAPAPAAPPYQPWPGCETVSFRNPRGESISFLMRAGATGRMMPPIQTTTLPVPAGNGSRYLGSAHLERVVAIPVVVPGSISDRAELRRWARVLDPTIGEGILSVIQGPWAGRELRCTYDAGLDELAEEWPTIGLATFLFRAAWPYWRDAAEQTVTVTQGATVGHWFPFLPLILGASDAFASFTITNVGDVPSWPVVTVVGPGQNVTVRNLTTGKEWTVNGTLQDGSVLVVDTRPGLKRVTIDGGNAFAQLTVGSALWPLLPGPNRVEVAVALTSPSSSVTVAWRNYWLAA